MLITEPTASLLNSESSEIPSIFCWTKMGTEAGQGLDSILYRKELERAAGNGSFAWGIGNSLGNAPHIARKESPTGSIEILFTPMKSSPKAVDSSPSQIFLWMFYENVNGSHSTLPNHMLVTSRGGENKRNHYALICHSNDRIEASDHGGFDAANVRNFVSHNPVGASQVTSIVRYETAEAPEKSYRVSFKATMHNEGFVRLVSPILMDDFLIGMYEDACQARSTADWCEAIDLLKNYAITRAGHQPQQGRFSFAEML